MNFGFIDLRVAMECHPDLYDQGRDNVVAVLEDQDASKACGLDAIES